MPGIELTTLSAMITPAVLILATSSLTLTTSQRLSRALERARKIYQEFERISEKKIQNDIEGEKIILLDKQIKTITHRAKLLQWALTTLHITLAIFIGTSMSIGIEEIMEIRNIWIPTMLGISGTLTLFYATVLLINESRIALFAIRDEMDYAVNICRRLKGKCK